MIEGYDKKIQAEVRAYFRMLGDRCLKDRRVLDLGAHKGFFTRAALDAEAKVVVAVEPYRGNFQQLKKNGKGAVLLHGACTGWGGNPISLTQSTRMRSDAAFSVARRAPSRVVVERVKQFKFEDLITDYEIDTVKMDCQGSEWGIFVNPIPISVDLMFGELHYSGRFAVTEDEMMQDSPLRNRKMTEAIFRSLEDRGFTLRFRRSGRWNRRPLWGSKDRFQDVIFERK